MSLYEECDREDHINPDDIGDCPRCGSKNVHIQESLKVYDYCDKIHFVDALECLNCDAIISLDLLLRLLTVEEELKRHGIAQTGT
jgi:hypothetical protein